VRLLEDEIDHLSDLIGSGCHGCSSSIGLAGGVEEEEVRRSGYQQQQQQFTMEMLGACPSLPKIQRK